MAATINKLPAPPRTGTVQTAISVPFPPRQCGGGTYHPDMRITTQQVKVVSTDHWFPIWGPRDTFWGAMEQYENCLQIKLDFASSRQHQHSGNKLKKRLQTLNRAIGIVLVGDHRLEKVGNHWHRCMITSTSSTKRTFYVHLAAA